MIKNIIEKFDTSYRIQQEFILNNADLIERIVCVLEESFIKGGKLLLCGNGGSAADVQHLAGEFVNRMLFDRNPLPAIALTTDISILTAIANDFDYKYIFSRQVEAIGKKGDVIFAYSTSGNSNNVLEAINTCKNIGITSFGFSGNKGKLKNIVDYPVTVQSGETPRIQEVHYILGHVIIEILEAKMFVKKN